MRVGVGDGGVVGLGDGVAVLEATVGVGVGVAGRACAVPPSVSEAASANSATADLGTRHGIALGH